jgi:hypothetical protein
MQTSAGKKNELDILKMQPKHASHNMRQQHVDSHRWRRHAWDLVTNVNTACKFTNRVTVKRDCRISQTMAMQLFVKQEVPLSPMATLVQQALRQARINLGFYNEVPPEHSCPPSLYVVCFCVSHTPAHDIHHAYTCSVN